MSWRCVYEFCQVSKECLSTNFQSHGQEPPLIMIISIETESDGVHIRNRISRETHTDYFFGNRLMTDSV